MIKLLPFLFIALPIAVVAQSKQQLVAQTKYATGLCTVDVQDLPAGNYVLHVQTGGNVATQKVVIAR